MKNISPIFYSLILSSLLIFPNRGLTQQKQFSLERAFDLVEQNNLSLKQLQQTIEQAEQQIAIQKTDYFPVLSSVASYNHVSELAALEIPFQIPGVTIPPIEAGVKNQYDLALVVKQPLFTGFRTKNLVNSARQQFKSEQIKKQILHHQLLFQVGRLFYRIQLNMLQQQVLRQSIQRVDLQRQKINHFLAAQQATGFDTLEVVNRKLQISNQLLKLQHVEHILQSRLLSLLNVEAIDPIEPLKLEEITLKLKDLDFYQNLAITKRPELQQISALKSAGRFQVNVAMSLFYPQIFASATYHYARPGVNFFKDEWMNYYTIGVNLQWELWNWNRTRRQAEKAQLAINQLNFKSQELILQIKQEVAEAYHYLLTSREQINLQKKLVEQERKRFQLISDKFEQNLATTLDLSDSENRLREAELTLQNNKIEWFLYRLQLDYATGIIGKE